MASGARAVCEYCGEDFANVLQLGPHKRYCWQASYGYQSSTSFTNSDSESNNKGSETDSDSDPADEEISVRAGRDDHGNVFHCERSSLMSLAQRTNNSSWVATPTHITNNNNRYLPSRTHDYTPVRPVTHISYLICRTHIWCYL